MQGIEWANLPDSRAGFRKTRIKEYATYRNETEPLDSIKKDIEPVRADGRFYDFRYTRLKEKCSIVHFQLRNLLWATSKHDIFYTYGPAVKLWCPITKGSRTVLNLSQHDLSGTKISTMAAKDNFLIVGGYGGEYVCRRLDGDPMVHTGSVTVDPSGITNHLDIARSRSGAKSAYISSNDERARIMDLSTLRITSTFKFDWPVNCTTLSPDKRILCVVGDDRNTALIDSESGDLLTTLKGHIDFSFACAWSPCGRFIATGNQDLSTRLYDTRNLSKSISTFGAKLGAVRSLHFSDDGRYLAMAEPADFVHLFDLNCPDGSTHQSQVIDFFGEIAGVSFTPGDACALYIGNAGRLSPPRGG
ncbi:WD40-repeat-containing domain protein [Blyttiomyces helicus]|uniref:WD40-repeat-containing domain protein n=1 Tax=Blyttiomyces helicus TaxID=388810 RepID=A0A4P9WMA6_9FUNG|nr:WD40-repeat-containing domain protein [Blyttiomyces helicus]|eukprot:RKO91846.1 WD40-repeat-containing domain protein [Blyttiomyces helicus]